LVIGSDGQTRPMENRRYCGWVLVGSVGAVTQIVAK
jgi:hypothetical protein